MKCIIVEDEPLAREGLEVKIKKLGYPTLVGSFRSGLEANKYLMEHEVDLIFLDIQMPDITGIDFFKSIKNPPPVIFTTAYSEYAIEGFELDAIDYLLKPYTFQRFVKAVNRARELHDLKHQATHEIESIQKDFIYLRANREFIKAQFSEIRYVEGMKNYVRFHTTKSKVMTAISLSKILDQLPESTFARINKSYIVNVDFIHKIVGDIILLDDDTELPIGRTFQEDFINTYIKDKLVERK